MRNVSRRRSKGEKKKMRGGEQNKVKRGQKKEERNRTRCKEEPTGEQKKGRWQRLRGKDGKGYGVRMAKVTG